MAGHSKFANIKHRKAKNDAERGRVFTRLGREIAVAVKMGGADVSANTRLKEVIAKAKSNNMPNDTIERSIKKAAGDLTNVNYESITYEGYGPGGAAIIVKVLTDNKNRTAANVRNAFTKGGGNLGTIGCVSFMFDDYGIITVPRANRDEDELTLLALEAGADDFLAEDDYMIITKPADFHAVLDVLTENGIEILSSLLTTIPRTKTTLTDADDIKKMQKLLDLLEDDVDVTEVYHNVILRS